MPCKKRSRSPQMWGDLYIFLKNQKFISTWFFNATYSDKSSYSTVTFNIDVYDVKEPLQIISQDIPLWEYLIFYG